MNPIDRFGHWCTALRKTHPMLGWTITIVSTPIAFLLGVAAIYLAPVVMSIGQ